MRNIFLALLAFAFIFNINAQQRYSSSDVQVELTSETDSRDFNVSTWDGEMSIDATNGRMNLQFSWEDMEYDDEELKEQVSSQVFAATAFPTVTFDGVISAFSSSTMKGEGSRQVAVNGVFTLNGEEIKTTLRGELYIGSEEVEIDLEVYFKLSDFLIEIPETLETAMQDIFIMHISGELYGGEN